MKKKNWIVVALCIAIVGMGIGFAALAQNLQINATANITGTWDVRITGVESFQGHGATLAGTPTFDGTSASVEVNLEYPGAVAFFQISVENFGNIDAKINSITGITAANSTTPIEIQYEVAAPGGCVLTASPWRNTDFNCEPSNTLPAGLNYTILVRVEWIVEDGVESVIPDVTSKTATINLNYIQAT